MQKVNEISSSEQDYDAKCKDLLEYFVSTINDQYRKTLVDTVAAKLKTEEIDFEVREYQRMQVSFWLIRIAKVEGVVAKVRSAGQRVPELAQDYQGQDCHH